jgi:LemA protein
MSTLSKIVIGGLSFFVLISFLVFLSGYNGAINADNNSDEAWGNYQSSLQRRSDLVPRIVATVKAEANFEKSTLEAVVQARASASQIKLTTDDLSDPEKVKQFEEAQQKLQGTLSRLLMTVENYPNLRSNQAFMDLRTTLEGSENRINEARMRYNKAVKAQNNTVRQFPTDIGAKFAGVRTRHAFEASEGAQTAPEVKF